MNQAIETLMSIDPQGLDDSSLHSTVVELQQFDSLAAAARWLTEADIERVVWASKSKVIDIGVRNRLLCAHHNRQRPGRTTQPPDGP